MSAYIPGVLVRKVRLRARGFFEYCRLPQDSQEATFHVDHVHPRSAAGPTSLDNLALACVTCSLRKAARLKGHDSRSRKSVLLFNPRQDDWSRHFEFTARWRLRGRTPTGRATVAALGMNRGAIVAIRNELADQDRFPPG